VDFDDVFKSRFLVQTINVLRDYAREQTPSLQIRERVMRVIGGESVGNIKAMTVKLPETNGVSAPNINVGDLHRIDLRPQTTR
jgi:hypothetical protein